MAKGGSNEISIRKVLLIANGEKEEAVLLAKEVDAWLSAQAIETRIIHYPHVQSPILFPEYDLAISLGGDGTVLYSSRLLSSHRTPILPINLGDFGFITEVTANEWQIEFENFRLGKAKVSSRMLIDVQVWREGRQMVQFVGLNDAVITGSGISKLIRYSVDISGKMLGYYRADGMIVATPTGSTAYSVAAGGPILMPELHALIINPICPFSISHRPLVVPSSEKIAIGIDAAQRTSILMTVDGQDEYQIEPNDKIILCTHPDIVYIIQSSERNFYEVLRDKLKLSGGVTK